MIKQWNPAPLEIMAKHSTRGDNRHWVLRHTHKALDATCRFTTLFLYGLGVDPIKSFVNGCRVRVTVAEKNPKKKGWRKLSVTTHPSGTYEYTKDEFRSYRLGNKESIKLCKDELHEVFGKILPTAFWVKVEAV